MSNRSELTLKALLWWLVVFHGALGLCGLFAKEFTVDLAARFFSFQLELSPQMHWILNPFAAYLLAFSGFMVIAARDPRRHTSLIHVAAALLGLRVVQRAFFLLTADGDLIAGGSRNSILLTLLIVLVIVVALVILTRNLNASASADGDLSCSDKSPSS